MRIRSFFLIAVIVVAAFVDGRSAPPSFVFDMHYGPLLGHGWVENDPGGVRTAIVKDDVPVGAYSIRVFDNVGLVPGILAVYRAVNGEYYSFKIRDVTGSEIFSDRPLQAISVGSIVANAYKNDAHPNIYGGAAIVDAFLRQASDPVLGATQTLEQANIIGATRLSAGHYVAKFPLTVHRAATITVEGERGVIARASFEGFDATYFAQMPFTIDRSSTVTISVSDGAAWPVNIYRIVAPGVNINAGKVLLLADSWGTPEATDVQASPIVQQFRKRLDRARFVAKGVSGNRSDQLLARFKIDVAAERPDTVIVIVGTNDYYQGVTPQAFAGNIAKLKAEIAAIGARAVIFTPSVGAPLKFAESRAYEAGITAAP